MLSIMGARVTSFELASIFPLVQLHDSDVTVVTLICQPFALAR